MNTRSYVVTPTYRLLIALLLSLLIHSTLLLDMDLTSHGHRDILQVRLTTPVPLASEIPGPAPAESPAPAQPPQQTIASTNTKAASSTTPSSVAAAPAETNTEPEKRPVLKLADRPGPANWAEINFEIFSGENRESLGTGLQHYESDDLGHYQLSFNETAKPQQQGQNNHWQINIEGAVTENGLRPSSYQLQGTLAEHLMAMSSSNNATPPGGSRKGRVPDGTLDRLSMLYQFMFLAADDTDGQLVLTDGNSAITYTYHLVGMESLEIPSQGLIRTLHLTLSANESRETTELWLAPHFRYLPIKLRLTDSNGIITELVATAASIR
jgi:hypothetical protein